MSLNDLKISSIHFKVLYKIPFEYIFNSFQDILKSFEDIFNSHEGYLLYLYLYQATGN